MGLIARVLEAAGVPTLGMSSAWDITLAVAPPRAIFVHHPLGHQTGAVGDATGQLALVRSSLEAGVSITTAGEILELPQRWQGDEGWEARAYSPDHTATGPDGKPMRG